MIVIYTFIAFFLFFVTIIFLVSVLSPRTLDNKVLSDLGLIRRWTGEKTTPFYKWGWKKISRERVWGERIVKSVFNKARVWLSPDDYQYFASLCYDNEEGRAINHDRVIARVKEILSRNEHVSSHIGQLVQNVLTYATSVSNQEAEKLLREMKYKAERDDPLTHLIKVQLRRKLKQAGIYILGNKPVGLELTNQEEEVIGKLKGFESWIQFVEVYEQECLKQLEHKVSPPYDKIFNLVKKSVQSNLFKDFKNDIADAKKFYKMIDLLIVDQELKITFDDVRHMESILYTWKFDDNIRFGFVEHRQIRELVAQNDTAPYFRELFIKSLNSDIASLGTLLNAFPRYVIFYGHNTRARAFTAQQYLYHFKRLLETLPQVDKFQRIAPLIIRVSESDIQEARLHAQRLKEKEKSLLSPNHQPIKIDIPNYIRDLIHHEMETSLRELDINQDTGNRIGWIINLGIAEPTNDELSALLSAEFRHYIRIKCDVTADADYTSAAQNAKEHRLMLFNTILESLISLPSKEIVFDPSTWSNQKNAADATAIES